MEARHCSCRNTTHEPNCVLSPLYMRPVQSAGNRSRTPAAWDAELARVEEHMRHFVTHKPSALVAVAVDDDQKADYFRPRLQRILNRHPELKDLTVRLVPMVGAVTELRAERAER